jgi:hypothetical protein
MKNSMPSCGLAFPSSSLVACVFQLFDVAKVKTHPEIEQSNRVLYSPENVDLMCDKLLKHPWGCGCKKRKVQKGKELEELAWNSGLALLLCAKVISQKSQNTKMNMFKILY